MPGFEAKFTHPLLKRHECPICLFPMWNPVQTECGHLFCHDCLEPVLKRRHPICPLDKEEITQEGTFPDKACRREILKLQVNCNFLNCPWVGTLKDLEGHLSTCDYRDEQCTQCGQYIQHLNTGAHQSEQCPMRPTTCPHCNKDVPIQQLQTHFDKLCTKMMRGCPNKCDKSLQMNLQELEKHIDARKGTCPLSEVACAYQLYGCTFISLRKDRKAHMEQSSIDHAQIQADFQEKQQQSFTESVEHILERVDSLAAQSNASEQRRDRYSDQSIAQLLRKMSRLETRAGITEQRFDLLNNFESPHDENRFQTAQNTSTITMVSDRFANNEIRGLFDTGQTSGYHTGSTAFGSAQPTTPNYQGFGGDHTISPQRVEALHTRVVELEHSVDRALSSCLDQELRIQLLERATYNGVLLWKIDEFKRRRREAVDGVTMSLYSTPFYTSRHGYKMCARIYLNGDGMGKGSHLSFFFVVMRGPFDALLQWPFKQKVTLTLINQNGKKHISDSFRPDSHSSSFQKPGRREMNIASGCPMFIRIDHLLNGGFVKDDAIYVRVVVETMDLPKIIP